MPQSPDNRDIFSHGEFDRWVHVEAAKGSLDTEEQFLIEKYFDKSKKTLEAGTGGGRILLALQKMGYTDLTGFDYVPEAVELAKKHDPGGTIQFDVENAVNLSYPDASFEQAIYAQQVLCFIEDENQRNQAIQEAFRILKPDSPAIFTALCMDTRTHSTFYNLYLSYLRLIRRLKNSHISPQQLPWLKIGNRINPGAILDHAPYTYWYHIQEFIDILNQNGFEILGFGTSEQLKKRELYTSTQALLQQPLFGHLYVITRRLR